MFKPLLMLEGQLGQPQYCVRHLVLHGNIWGAPSCSPSAFPWRVAGSLGKFSQHSATPFELSPKYSFGSMSNFCLGWSTYWNDFINHLFLVFKHSQIRATIKFNIHSLVHPQLLFSKLNIITFLDSLTYFSRPLPPQAVSAILENDFSQ